MLFIFPFDVQLLATIIAQELARLRQFHKYYLDFIKKTLSYGLAFFGKKYLYGLKIVIKGQLTSYRRRMKRSQLIAFLREKGIFAVFHYVPLHTSPAGLRFGEFKGKDVFTTAESERLVRLPLHRGLTLADVDYVSTAVSDFFSNL